MGNPSAKLYNDGAKGSLRVPKEAVDEFIAKVRPAYERTGKPGAFVVHQQPGVHSLTPEAFEAMFGFFQKEL